MNLTEENVAEVEAFVAGMTALRTPPIAGGMDIPILALCNYWRENEALVRESEGGPKEETKEPVCRLCGKIKKAHSPVDSFCLHASGMFLTRRRFEP